MCPTAGKTIASISIWAYIIPQSRRFVYSLTIFPPNFKPAQRIQRAQTSLVGGTRSIFALRMGLRRRNRQQQTAHHGQEFRRLIVVPADFRIKQLRRHLRDFQQKRIQRVAQAIRMAAGQVIPTGAPLAANTLPRSNREASRRRGLLGQQPPVKRNHPLRKIRARIRAG